MRALARAAAGWRPPASLTGPQASRYLAGSWGEIAGRLSVGLALAPEVAELLAAGVLVPAGNILAAFGRLPDGSRLPIYPNCAVLEPTEGQWVANVRIARKLWAHNTGVGFYLGDLADPARAVRELQAACSATRPAHGRPQRGNMAVVPASHPRVLDFVRSKGTVERANATGLFNNSVSFRNLEHMVASPGLLREIAAAAWATGCPGVVLEDRLQACPKKPGSGWDRYRALVPCGEQTMYPGETCALAAVNLASPLLRTGTGDLDLAGLASAAEAGVDLLNRVLDQTTHVDPFTAAQSREFRRVGLGVTGFADLLAELDLVYGEGPAVRLADQTAAALARTGRAAAARHGNVSATCLQPTGGVTGLLRLNGYSIEPDFLASTRLPLDAHLRTLDAFQRHLDNGVSKTINLPANTTPDQVLGALLQAFQTTCARSVTVFRDGCRDQPVRLTPATPPTPKNARDDPGCGPGAATTLRQLGAVTGDLGLD